MLHPWVTLNPLVELSSLFDHFGSKTAPLIDKIINALELFFFEAGLPTAFGSFYIKSIILKIPKVKTKLLCLLEHLFYVKLGIGNVDVEHVILHRASNRQASVFELLDVNSLAVNFWLVFNVLKHLI